MSAGRRIARVLVALVGVALAALLLAIAVVALFGVSIDASRWRDVLASRASVALGRQVALDGVLVFELGREAAVHVGGVRILNPAGFAAPELATLGEARVRIDLLEALRGRLLVHSFEAAAGRVRLERAADGRANWAPPPRASGASQPGRTGPALDAIEIQRASIRNFAFEYYDARSGAKHALDLDELVGIGKWSEPLKLSMRGRIARGRAGPSFPYTIDIDGGSAQLLQEGREAWPFTLDFAFLGTRLHATGTLDVGQGTARFDFGAGTEDLAQIEGILQTELPNFGPAALTGKALVQAASVELSGLHGVLGASELTGSVALGLGSGRRRLDGELAITALDLRPLLAVAPQSSGPPPSLDERMRRAPPVRDLVPVDGDLVLRIGSWTGLPFEVRDVQLALHADERRVRVPVSGTIAGVPLTGRIDLDRAGATPSLALELDAANLPLRGLRQMVPLAEGVDGQLGRVALRLGGRGETLGAIVADLDARLVVAGTRLRYASATRVRPVDLTLDTIEVTAGGRRPLRGTVRAALLGEKATLAFTAGGLEQMLRETATPIELKLAAAGASARAEGTIAWGAPRASDLAFRFDARRVGDLARWLAVDSQSNLPLAVRGRMRVDSEWHLEKTKLRLGRSEFTVDAHRKAEDGESIIAAAVSSRLIDIPELRTLRRQTTVAEAHSLTDWLGIPILPRGMNLAAADVEVGLTRVVLGRIELADLGLRARVRGGQLVPSTCAARLAGVPFDGIAGMDLRGAVPELSLTISTGAVDVGRLLRVLGAAENLEAHADALQMRLIGRGSTVGELLQGSSLELRLQGGDLSVTGPARRAVAEIRLENTLVAVAPGKPITVRLQGALDDTPAEVAVTTGTLADFARDASRVPLALEAKAAGARLAIDGEVLLPIGRGGDLRLTLAGDQLDSLSTLVRAALPPWGPWSVAGPISMTRGGYEIEKLAVRIGNSSLYGQGRLDLSGARPRVDARLRAPEVQLDDFPFERTAGERRALNAQSVRETAGRTSARTQDLLSAAFLRRFDAYLDVEVEEVRSGPDPIGNGVLRAQLVEGRLDVGSADIRLPGGGVRLSLAYDPTGSEIDLAVHAAVERFDYRFLSRRVRPGTDASGLFSLKLDLTGRTPTLPRFLAHANGRVDIAVWPKNLRSGVFNRWTVNLLFQLLPFIDPNPDAQVNCVVVRVDMRDGKLTDDAILIDTSRARVVGAGSADFVTQEIGFRFRPRTKGPVLFSLQPPIDVTGSMSDFRVGVGRGTMGETMARFFTSVFVVPFEILTRGRMPADGADVCTDPLRTAGRL